MIHPCQFASGNEPFVAESLEGVDTVVPPAQYLRCMLWGSWWKRYGFKKEGVILSLGGSLKHPVAFKKRAGVGYPLYAYTNNPDLPGREKEYERVFVRNEYVRDKYLARGVPDKSILIVGDLVKSSIASNRSREDARKSLGAAKGETVLAVMPGSRAFQVHFMLPAFLKAADDLTGMVPDIRVIVLKSPFVTYRWIEEALAKGGKIKEGNTIGGTLLRNKDEAVIQIRGNKTVPVLEGGLEEWGEAIDLAVTLPGSNTMQLAYRRIPMLTVMPLNKPEIIPIVGPLAVLKYIPLLGKPLLKKAALSYTKKFRFAALPNIYRNEAVVPELFGVIRVEQITEMLSDIIENNGINEIRKRLSVFDTGSDPADEIVRHVWG
ncbi:MAG: hypothetical protein JXQ30_03380 [Spirochaetes bacterium]|nr:hypothetical protein [Spirochaetota bacterium]